MEIHHRRAKPHEEYKTPINLRIIIRKCYEEGINICPDIWIPPIFCPALKEWYLQGLIEFKYEITVYTHNLDDFVKGPSIFEILM